MWEEEVGEHAVLCLVTYDCDENGNRRDKDLEDIKRMKIEGAWHEMICGGQKEKERDSVLRNGSSTNNSSRNGSRGVKRKKCMNVTHTVKISGQTSDGKGKRKC